MNILYSHEAPETDCCDTRRIVVERLCDGSTDITIIVGECGKHVSFMNHDLSIAESDKIGAAICKDIIDNYRRHATNLKDKISDLENAARDMRNSNNNLLNENTALQIARISSDDKRDEYKETLATERIDHMADKRAINQTHHDLHRRNGCVIEELEANISDLRCVVHERNNTINNVVIEHNSHSEQLYAKIEELTKTNSALKHDLCEQQERWDRFVIR